MRVVTVPTLHATESCLRLWEAATDMSNVNIWFSWASYIKQTDKSPLAVGKRFRLGYRLPLMGDYTFIATVKEYQKEKSVGPNA